MPMQSNFTYLQTCMQAFLRSPMLSHLSLASYECILRDSMPHPFRLLIPLLGGDVSIHMPMQFHMPPNMHASIFTESNALPPFIGIIRVYFKSLEATPLSVLFSIARGDVSIHMPMQSNFWVLSLRLHWVLSLRLHWVLSLRLHWDLSLRLHWALSLRLHWALSLRLHWALSFRLLWALSLRLHWALSLRLHWALSL